MGKRGFRGRNHGPPGKRRRNDGPQLSSRQKKHLKEFGEFHPADSRDTVRNYSKVVDEENVAANLSSSSSESEEEEETAYKQLLHLVGAKDNADEDTSEEEEEKDGEEGDEDDVSSDAESGSQGLETAPEHSLIQESEDGSEDDEEDDDEENGVNDSSEDSEPVNPSNEKLLKKAAHKKRDSGSGESEDSINDSDAESESKGDTDSDAESESKGDTDRNDTGKKTDYKKMKKKNMKSVGEEEEKEEEGEEEETLEEGDDDGELQLKEDDPFSMHFERDLPEDIVENLSSTQTWQSEDMKLKTLGAARMLWKEESLVPKTKGIEKDLKKAGVKHKLVEQISVTNIKECGVDLDKHGDIMTPLQHCLFSIMNKYQDLLYPQQTFQNMEEIRLVYCLHAVNHVLKTRSRVVAHNTKLRDRAENADNADVEYRDQGLTRPKVLVVLPTRHGAYRVVSHIMGLLSASDQGSVSKRKRFREEYGDEGHDDNKKGLKPEDYDALFAGNIDDDFRIGLSMSKKSLRLFSPFYMSDIIIASPLGLRRLIDAPHKKGGDYDFLSSIEMLIFDQTDFFMMQNWDHVLTILEHMHLQPRESHGVDFSRTRMWTLNGWAKHYRQTLIFSSILMPAILTVFNKHCHNYAGKVQVHCKPTQGTVCQIAVQLPQMFHRVECASHNDQHEARFQFFLKEVLPQHKERDMKQTLIYVPSYYDYTRLRNYFKKEAISFTHISEYDSSKGVRRARIEFKRKKAQFMLYTDRVHFFRRFKLRGPKHIIFYELPQYPHFYSEMCNMLEDPGRIYATDTLTCTVLYTRFDALKLREVVGTKRADRMIASEKPVHMLVSGDTS